MDGPWEGAQNVPDANPSMVGNFGVVPFPGTVAGPARSGKATSTSSPRVLLTLQLRSSSLPGSPGLTT